MSDISKIALNGVTYDVKDEKARSEKVAVSGGDIANTEVSAFTASTASYPVPAAGETPKVFMGKIKKFFEDIRNAATGACFIGQIVNNCVTDRADMPLSAAQGKKLMDLYTVLNTNLTSVNSNCPIGLGGKQVLYGSTQVITDANGAGWVPFGPNFKDGNIFICLSAFDSNIADRITWYNVAYNGMAIIVQMLGAPVTNTEVWVNWIAIGMPI